MDLIYICFASLFIGIIAHVRGRSGVGWAILTPVLAYGFAALIAFYLQHDGVGLMASLLMAAPFLYGSPIATFVLLLALGRPTPAAERAPASPAAAKFWGDPVPQAKVDPLAAMTRRAPEPEPDVLPAVVAPPAARQGAASAPAATIPAGGGPKPLEGPLMGSRWRSSPCSWSPGARYGRCGRS